jgi:S-adenosylmethionine:tRNA ribosyltransferase-isomerase
MLVSEFDYELPADLIAQHPAPQRSASRLLHLEAASGKITDLAFSDLPGLVDARDVLVLNDTRVVKARLAAHKASGGKVELFVERALDAREALVLIRASHPPAAGSELVMHDLKILVLGREGELYRVRFPEDIEGVLERFGAVPLPPYIRHAPQAVDAERYQTVYADVPGAVAAPTAGLHFDGGLLKAIEERGAKVAKLTLHVGFGTFQPVRVEEVQAHRMHRERYRIPPATLKAIEGKRVLAVGTTSLRALESHALHLSGIRVPRGQAPADQLSPAEIHAAHAGRGIRRARQHPPGVRARHRQALPVFLLRRRHADRTMNFKLLKKDGNARRGILELAHGRVDTPAFMPVGTYGTVKAMSPGRWPRSARRSCSATPSTCGCGPGWK